jgi:hypothetical protein
MSSECFTLSTELNTVTNILNEGGLISIILACMMAITMLYSIYSDNKKPVGNIKRLTVTSNQIIGVNEEFKELEESQDNENALHVIK